MEGGDGEGLEGKMLFFERESSLDILGCVWVARSLQQITLLTSIFSKQVRYHCTMCKDYDLSQVSIVSLQSSRSCFVMFVFDELARVGLPQRQAHGSHAMLSFPTFEVGKNPLPRSSLNPGARRAPPRSLLLAACTACRCPNITTRLCSQSQAMTAAVRLSPAPEKLPLVPDRFYHSAISSYSSQLHVSPPMTNSFVCVLLLSCFFVAAMSASCSLGGRWTIAGAVGEPPAIGGAVDFADTPDNTFAAELGFYSPANCAVSASGTWSLPAGATDLILNVTQCAATAGSICQCVNLPLKGSLSWYSNSSCGLVRVWIGFLSLPWS
jgi:hypothetical protein